MNKVIITGRVGKIDIAYTASSVQVAKISIATNKKWKAKDGTQKEDTTWHNCVAFDKRAGSIEKYVKKGDMFSVVGELRNRSWEDKKHPGVKRYATEILISELEFLPNPKKDEDKDKGAVKVPEEVQTPDVGDEDIPF